MTPEQEVEFQRLEEYGLDLEHETPDTLVRGFLFAERHEIREAIVRFRQRFKSIEMPRAKAYEQEECILAALRIQELVSKLSSQVEAALMELLPEKQVGGLLPADKTRVAEAIALDREQDAAEHGNDYGLIKARIATWIVRDIGLPESTQEYRLMRELSRVDEEPQDPANFNVPFNVLLALRRKRGEAEPESVHRSFPSSMVGRPTTCAFGDVSRLSMHVLAEWQPKSQEVYDYLLGYTEERYGGSLTGVEAGAALDRWLAEHPFPRNVVWDNDGVVNSEEAQNDTTVGEDAGTRIVNDGDINPDHNSLKTRGVRTGHLDGNLRHID
ncbi:uncharacterized protein HMPREF1541_10454 [Cyphellophora europaea CBS 101466]|uniref:Uncharacterized protein n=1 Tax=Cyphellophora europaea (strain CBS 101466) TaxID=1220924 RepID=W2S8L4_CYPE1|nr:uncharacterized protein HMPREF1541_10454 [Cyphellophora europaea CBS 101466]ETN44274.1 hypothetical protein HMPREF1541_10454 [Cyphellophora europaea CBS 101466]